MKDRNSINYSTCSDIVHTLASKLQTFRVLRRGKKNPSPDDSDFHPGIVSNPWRYQAGRFKDLRTVFANDSLIRIIFRGLRKVPLLTVT
jgi:hypothetical protein